MKPKSLDLPPLGALISLQDLGRAISTLRRQTGLSQTAMGKAAGLSRMPVYRLEAGQDISLRSFLALLTALKHELTLRPASTGVMRPADLKAAFAHLHTDEDAP